MFKEITLISLPSYVEPVGFAKEYNYQYMLFLGRFESRTFYITNFIKFEA